MKQKLKKMLLALMMGIGIMGAVSAQAQEKEWVRVGDYEVYYVPIGPMSTKVPLGTASTLDAVCQNVVVPWAASRANSVYRYDGEYRVSISGGKRTSKGMEWITCDYTNPANGRSSNAGAYFICNESMIDLDRPDGCYEEKNKCKADEARDPKTGECVVPCTGIGEDGTASPKGCVPVNAEECDEKRSRFKKTPGGFVSCNNGDRNTCSYPRSKLTDPEAARFGLECVFVHEYSHILDASKYGGNCVKIEDTEIDDPLGVLSLYNPLSSLSEAIAYNKGATCLLERQKDCSTQACIDQTNNEIDRYIDESKERLNDYKCATTGTNCK